MGRDGEQGEGGGGSGAAGRAGVHAMILMIDTYDSFTWNLVQYLGELGSTPEVVRNDEITVGEVERRAPSAIVISPGPGRPADAGVSSAVIERMAGKVPILGECLGRQCIGEAFG